MKLASVSNVQSNRSDRHTNPNPNSNLEHEPEPQLKESEPLTISSPLWQKVRTALKQRFGDKGEALDKSWFSKLDIEVKAEANPDSNNTLSNSNNQTQQQNLIKIKCPNSFTKDWIKTNYGSAIEDATKYATGQFAEVEYEVLS